MTKYQDLYQIFVDDIQAHHQYAQECLDFADSFVGQLARHLEWDEDDAEYVSLSYPINPNEFIKAKRLDLRKSNKNLLEKVVYLVDDFWYFGVRLILKCRRTSVVGKNKEVSFLIPLFVKQDGEGFIFKTDLQSETFTASQAEQFYTTVAAQILQLLNQGVQKLLDRGEASESLSKTGFVLQVQELLPVEELPEETTIVSDTSSSEPTPAVAEASLSEESISEFPLEILGLTTEKGVEVAELSKTSAINKRSAKTSKTSKAIATE